MHRSIAEAAALQKKGGQEAPCYFGKRYFCVALLKRAGYKTVSNSNDLIGEVREKAVDKRRDGHIDKCSEGKKKSDI